MKQLAERFGDMTKISSFAPEPPRNPDPPPPGRQGKLPNLGTLDPPLKRPLAMVESEDGQAKSAIISLSAPSTLRDKLMERRRWEGLARMTRLGEPNHQGQT